MAGLNLPIVDWLEIKATAPAKFIISGEYSVVFDKQAVASAIELTTRVTIRPGKEGKVRLNLKDLNTIRVWPCASLTTIQLVSKFSECLAYTSMIPGKLSHLLNSPQSREQIPTTSAGGDDSNTNTSRMDNRELEKKADDAAMAFMILYIALGDSFYNSARPPLEVEVESSIPVGSGLGSSSAYSVALCGALMRVFRVTAERYIISNWAFQIDKFFHGKPSGVDNNVVTFGGYILFQHGKIKGTGLKHKGQIKVMLIDSCVSRSTKTLSEQVLSSFIEDPVRISDIFNHINETTTQIWRKLNDPDFQPYNIAESLKMNQEYLDELGVGHEKLTDICTRAREFNLTAKQTGAGGGGAAFVLYNESDDCESINMLRRNLIEAGYNVHDHSIGWQGLTVNVKPDPSYEDQSQPDF